MPSFQVYVGLPFSGGDNHVIYVESQFNPGVNRFIESHIEEIKSIFSNGHLEFCYIPEAFGRIWDMGGLDGIEPSLICNGRCISLGDKLVFEAFRLDTSCLDQEDVMMDQLRGIAKAYSRHEASEGRKVDLDEETALMLGNMERIAWVLKSRGVRPKALEELISSLEQPSCLRIDRGGHVVLPDFGDMQIRLNPMEKALYHFFLCHPEGILADGLELYRDELVSRYRKACAIDGWELAENAADAFFEEDRKTFRTNVARIKTKFVMKLGERAARHYIIRKGDDGLYRIALPSDMVEWQG